MYNKCTQDGIFSSKLKIAKVTPIFKNGFRYTGSNYRPISVLLPFSKIFEKIIYSRLNNYFSNHNILTRGGVLDTRLKAKAKTKDTKKIRGQGQPFRGQTLSRPRTGMLEAKAKDQGHKRKCPKKKVFKKVFQAISNL